MKYILSESQAFDLASKWLNETFYDLTHKKILDLDIFSKGNEPVFLFDGNQKSVLVSREKIINRFTEDFDLDYGQLIDIIKKWASTHLVINNQGVKWVYFYEDEDLVEKIRETKLGKMAVKYFIDNLGELVETSDSNRYVAYFVKDGNITANVTKSSFFTKLNLLSMVESSLMSTTFEMFSIDSKYMNKWVSDYLNKKYPEYNFAGAII
jgi:hypothetical protein